MYSSTLSLTSALERDGWLTPRPGRFTPGKESRYALLAPGLVWTGAENPAPPEFDPQMVLPTHAVCYQYTQNVSR